MTAGAGGLVSLTEINEQALELTHPSLDMSDPAIDKAWQQEALLRLQAYDEGRLECVSLEQAFRDL